jgi:hypothetical protein
MSVQSVEEVLDHSRANGLGRTVLICLAERADRYGEDIYPSAEDTARRANCSVRSVRRCLAALRELGEIEQTGVTKWGVPIYRLSLGGDEVSPPLPERQGVEDTESGGGGRDVRGDLTHRQGGDDDASPKPSSKPSVQPSSEPSSESPTPSKNGSEEEDNAETEAALREIVNDPKMFPQNREIAKRQLAALSEPQATQAKQTAGNEGAAA